MESNNLDDETQKKSLSDKAVSDSPLDDKRVQIPKSKVAPGGFSFHTFEDLPERHIDNAGDESSLEFYLSPTASPGSRRSDRRESGVTERGISPMSVAATSPAGGSDLAALAALVESGRIQSIRFVAVHLQAICILTIFFAVNY